MAKRSREEEVKNYSRSSDFCKQIHSDFLKLYSSDISEYTDSKGNIVSCDVASLRFPLINYFIDRDISPLRKMHFKLTRKRAGIKEMILSGDSTKEAALDMIFAEKYKTKRMYYQMEVSNPEEYKLARNLAKAQMLHSRKDSILKVSPKQIATDLESYFVTRNKMILIMLSMMIGEVDKLYTEMWINYTRTRTGDDGKIF